MKILAVIGSPHKGNTYKVVQQVEEAMKECGNDVEFEYLFLKDAQIEPCWGCFLCVTKGEQFCPIKDERTEIEQKIKNADGTIFASPVYVFNVSANMKNFIDRMSYINHRPRFFDKYALAVVTSCGGGISETLKYLEESVLRSWGFNFVGKLGIMKHPGAKSSIKTMNKIENTARDFYFSIKKRKVMSPTFNQIMQFRIMRSNSLTFKEQFSADYEFYKSKGSYYINTKINVFKSALAGILEKVIVSIMGSAS